MASQAFSEKACEAEARSSQPSQKQRALRYSASSYDALSRNLAHKFAQDHALSIYRSDAIYSFIPKNGCSTMRLSIALHNGCISSEDDIAWIHKNNFTFSASLRDLLVANYTFVVLRCPYRRIVSLFLDKIASKEHNMLAAFVGPRWRRPLVPLGRHREQITFRRFLSLLSRPGAVEKNHHWQPQSRFLVYKAYDEYFRVEALNDARYRLLDRIGLKLQDARDLTGHGTHSLRKMRAAGCADLPATELQSMRKEGVIPHYSDFFDAETISVVQNLYMEDIDLYSMKFGKDSLLC